MRVSEGGGVDGENVEVVEMKVGDVINYANQTCVPSPVCFLFGLHWFLFNKYNQWLIDWLIDVFLTFVSIGLWDSNKKR